MGATASKPRLHRWKIPAAGKALRQALAETFADRPEHVSTADVDRAIYGRDLWPREMIALRQGIAPEGPAAVVYAKETRDVADAVSVARRLKIPLIPYAAGSGVCGGARSLRGALVVDLKALNAIGPLDKKSHLIHAQCGAQGEKLERYLNDRGFTLGHFPSSIYTSTVGGWLSTRSAGQLSTKYGKIEEMVVSLEAVLPDGRGFVTPDAPRSAAGPDFKQLLIGAEGTLGIITAATLRVHRIPEERTFQGFAFPSWAAACDAVREAVQQRVKPAVVRLYDEADTQLNAAHMKIKIEGILGVFVCEGEGRLTRFEAQKLAQICASFGAKDLGEGPARRWWDHRYDVSYNLSKVLPHPGMILDTMEVAGTWSVLPELYKRIRAALAQDAMVVLCHLSHAYLTGASLYFSFVARSESEEGSQEKYDALWKRALDAALGAGGTLSHHHGVGELKAAWMEAEHGAFQDLYRGLKERLDPGGIFNPGKVLPPRGEKTPPKRARAATRKTPKKNARKHP